MPDDFCVFILSHGRADRLYTLKTLKASGYTGRWYVVIDNEDAQEHEYRKRYGEHVIQFDKLAESKTFDTMDTSDDRRCIVYARNACFRLAKEVGCRYFLELDDDYTSFEYRYSEDGKLKVKKVKDLDSLFMSYLDFLNDTGAATVAMAQGGDLIGGSKSKKLQQESSEKGHEHVLLRCGKAVQVHRYGKRRCKHLCPQRKPRAFNAHCCRCVDSPKADAEQFWRYGRHVLRLWDVHQVVLHGYSGPFMRKSSHDG